MRTSPKQTKSSPVGMAESAVVANVERPLQRALRPVTSRASLADRLVEVLAGLGVRRAFGVFGGAIAPFAEAVKASRIELVHFRHEGGAAFAAIEASLASGEPVVVFATTGPGLTNLLTGMLAARSEGARVLYVSGMTNAAQRGRGAFQETSPYAHGCEFFYQSGSIFHHARVLEDGAELDVLAARLQVGLAQPNGFVAHVGLPLAAQTAPVASAPQLRLSTPSPAPFDARCARECAALLSSERFVVWVGFGARGAAAEVRQLAERTGARVMCSPRAKGIMPEDHPAFLGVTGLGGHEAVRDFMRQERPSRVLVLGSRLGELTSFWSTDYLPRDGLIHVDIDPAAFGVGFPHAEALCIQAEVQAFLAALLEQWPTPARCEPPMARKPSAQPALHPRGAGPVRPSYLFSELQRTVVDQSEAIVLTEAGNAFLLGSRHLAFREPGRYRVSTSFGSMGQAAAGVLGASLAHGKAFAIVGDGAMLMHNEMSTAQQYGIGAVWIILNDSRYGMIAQGMQAVGWAPFDTDIPRVDFVAVARGMGVAGVRVDNEAALGAALEAALASTGPFVVDVWLDRDEPPVKNPRNQSLVAQGVNGARVS
jgi:acetolactate synthase I/II/III large subunit